ncbi:hypothetical protein HDU96_009927 [Phlyctochytrium bullatum]|nr:hypothetical protein HDU96_009927 [Phlyctochytrium bullatum]
MLLTFRGYGILFVVYESGLIGLFDAYNSGRFGPLISKQIEYFSDASETMVAFPHLISQIQDSVLEAPNFLTNAVVLSLPHGIIFSVDCLDNVFKIAEKHLDNLALAYFIHEKAQSIPDFKQIQFQPNNLRIMFGVPIGLGGLIGNMLGQWAVKLVLRGGTLNIVSYILTMIGSSSMSCRKIRQVRIHLQASVLVKKTWIYL